MSVEEDKELRDLVVQTLQKKGVLSKVQAEIRASVFLALEEQDVFKDKSPFINKPLKEYVKTEEGALVVSLVREFLEFFNLEFTTMVFDPETHAGFDYKYEGRSRLAKELLLGGSEEGRNVPLLGQLLLPRKKMTPTSTEKENFQVVQENIKNKEIPLSTSSFDDIKINTNGIIHSIMSQEEKQPKQLDDQIPSPQVVKKLDPIKTETNAKPPSAVTGLSSLGGLPPLGGIGKLNKVDSRDKAKTVTDELKDILDFGLGDTQYEEDFMSSSSEKVQKQGKSESESEESEIEEAISSPSNNSHADDVTVDISISKTTGHGDYMEDV